MSSVRVLEGDKKVSTKTVTYAFKASSCKKYDAWKTIDRPIQNFGISPIILKRHAPVFNRSFHQRETKIGTVNASAIYGLQLLVRDPDLHTKVIGRCSSL